MYDTPAPRTWHTEPVVSNGMLFSYRYDSQDELVGVDLLHPDADQLLG